MRKRQSLTKLIAALALAAPLPIPALADDDSRRAVAHPNGKLSIEGGKYDDERSFLALGSFSLPLGNTFGLQIDGAAGRIDDDTMWGGGAHLFTRDPSSYLLGIYGSHHEWNGIKISRAAAEVEFYLDRISITGLGGYESVDVPAFSSGLQVLNTDDDHFFGHLDLAFYPLDDLKIYGGYRYISEVSLGAAGAEYQLRQFGSPISLFVNGRFGDEDHTRITGGLRLHFGADNNKSLIDRHRTEDPQNYTPIFPKVRTSTPAVAEVNACPVTIDFGNAHFNFCFGKGSPITQEQRAACNCNNFND